MIKLARQALEIHTQLHGTENIDVAGDMTVLADALDFFNDVDDDEVLRLHKQAILITSRLEGSLSVNIAVSEQNTGNAYRKSAHRAHAANELDRCIANYESALRHFREAARIYGVINHVKKADYARRVIDGIEEYIRQIRSI